MRVRLALFLVISFCANSFASDQYDLNSRCLKAYQEIFKLKFEKGRVLLEEERKENPKNIFPAFIENYIDFLSIYISEEQTLFEAAEVRKNNRLEIIKNGPKDSPYYLYLQAEIHLQWASARLKFEEYVPAFFGVRKAHKLLKENMERYPDFKPNKKSLGFLITLFGAIPDKYRFGAKLFGMKGDIEDGLKMLSETVYDKNFPFKEESAIMYTMLQLHLAQNHELAWEMINNKMVALNDNLLNYFVASSVAYYTGENDKLIEILKSRPKGKEYFPFPFLDFLLGLGKLNRLDKDADIPLHTFLDKYEGKTYIKDAYRKLAWHALIQNDKATFEKYRQLCILKGTEIIDEDISAKKEAERNIPHNIPLLKARLLFDGAYLNKALNLLDSLKVESFSDKYHILEYHYRKARVYHKIGRLDDAIKSYSKTIETGKELPIYYAANASLKLGNIYETKGNNIQATKYYKLCSSMKNHEYENSITAEAKAGLNRIKK